MTEYDNRGRFTLFKNDRRDRENSPEYNGTFTDEEGAEYWVNAWVKTAKDGRKFFSGTIKRKQPLPTPASQTSQPNRLGGSLKDQLNDEIPF